MKRISLFVAGVIVALLLADVTGKETRRPFQSSKAPKGIDVTVQVHGLANDPTLICIIGY